MAGVENLFCRKHKRNIDLLVRREARQVGALLITSANDQTAAPHSDLFFSPLSEAV